MARTMLQEPSSKPDFMFRCQLLGAKGITNEVMCAEAFKELKGRIKPFLSIVFIPDCILCIGKTQVWTVQGLFSAKEYTHDIRRILFITQDPVDETVFGYVFSQRNHPIYMYKLYAFKSGEAEFIIKFLRGYIGAATNILTEATGSLDGAGDFSKMMKHFQKKDRKEANFTSIRAPPQKGKQELADWSEKMGEMTQQLENVQNQLQWKDYECFTLQYQVSFLLRQREEQCQEVDAMRRQKASVETQLRQMEQQLLWERDRVEAQNQRLRQMEQQLAQKKESSYDWIISRNEVQVTNKRLGSGGWGTVYEGRYCGCAVAVKQIREDFTPACSLKMFQREIDMASKCRHPCLLQFIGATIDGGFPLLVTELMETSLRRLLCKSPLSTGEASIISLDVAQALNYLHQKRPVPMIHRDISSANVLLWRKAGRETGIQKAQWRGKVSDYGTAKFVEQVMTQTPGCLAYSAPEARTTTQTAKIDVYSFGVLLCEMCIREYPEPGRRYEQVDKMSNRALQELVRQCLQTNPDDRPDMTEIIDKLEQFQEVLRKSYF